MLLPPAQQSTKGSANTLWTLAADLVVHLLLPVAAIDAELHVVYISVRLDVALVLEIAGRTTSIAVERTSLNLGNIALLFLGRIALRCEGASVLGHQLVAQRPLAVRHRGLVHGIIAAGPA